MHEKVIERDNLIPLVSAHRAQGHRIVFTNGCFDLMHVGHTRYLQSARKLGDLLIVGVNTDRSVRTLNKALDRPIIHEQERAEVVAALGCVDYVVLFDESDPGRLIEDLLPDVLVKGGDWSPDKIIGRDVVKARGGIVTTIPLVPGVSTTAIVEKIKKNAVHES